ncbi:LOW QUALITY PROTEIN: eukaryotic translation initiation factor 1A, X-chromosomal-like [Petromyzon marinus]|uniref:LOW QUALITY PROTEIN: eukaryotic translation initiation factor 1A, X-chromosomal-like n=1 Tax=Petromyzon marinus TaxID=7757 RepID=UPI003F7170DB
MLRHSSSSSPTPRASLSESLPHRSLTTTNSPRPHHHHHHHHLLVLLLTTSSSSSSSAMPKNKGKGGKNRRRGKNENESEKRELVFKEDGQEYAQVIKMLGNGRLEAMCFDGVKRLCHIRGKLRKKVWITRLTLSLWGLRDYQDTKADVILKYNADEARSLKAYGELPEHAKINETDTFGPGEEDDILFDDIGDDEEDIDDI